MGNEETLPRVQRSAPWSAGFRAGQLGKQISECPYPRDAPEHIMWISGLECGRAKPMRIVRGLKPRG